MGIASVVLGVVAMVCAIAGFILSWVPFLGALLSFGSPVLALIGVVLGGVALSRAKDDGAETGIPLAGLIVSVVAFFPALLVALTCGVCNSMCTAASMNPSRGSGATPYYLDGGNMAVSPGITPVPAPAYPSPTTPVPVQPVPNPNAATPGNPGNAVPPTQPVPVQAPVPVQPALPPGTPPPAFPPPPPG